MTEVKIQAQSENLYKESFLSLSKAGRITALWALSESTLGGLLHALKLPFRGMIISSAAIILIGMIAKFSDKRGQIIKSTLVVIFIKAAISPHSPATAYLSVLIQGIIGEFLFFSKRFTLISSLIFGIVISLLNGFQRVLVLTLIYGNTLWKSIDHLLNYIAKDWLFIPIDNQIKFSLLLIILYVGMHLLIGITAGIFAYTIPKSVKKRLAEPALFIPIINADSEEQKIKKAKKRKWLKPSAIAIILIASAVVILNYFYPLSDKMFVNDIIIMIVRSILIMSLWFFVFAPRVKNYIKKFFYNRQNKYAKDINLYLTSIPTLKGLIAASWKNSSSYKGVKKLNQFIITSLVYLLQDYKSN
ncbi:MAG: hypothetical protein BroJett005_16230 [Ignavibacteriota bacterium]|nr:MAG: hypothetical protein BroJett005_16230 [Ignavibacteriota bacterium]